MQKKAWTHEETVAFLQNLYLQQTDENNRQKQKYQLSI